MHAELAAVPDSLYNVTRANRVIASVSIDTARSSGRWKESDSLPCDAVVESE